MSGFFRKNPFALPTLLGLAGILFSDFALGGPLPGARHTVLGFAVGWGFLAVAGLGTAWFPRIGKWGFWAGVFAAFVAMHALQTGFGPGLRLLESTGRAPGAWVVEGTVVETRISPEGGKSSLIVEVSRVDKAIEWEEAQTARGRGLPGGHAKIAVRVPGLPPVYGDRLRAWGTLREIPPPRNPGAFDYREWQARRGIYQELEIRNERDVEIIGNGGGNPLLRIAQAARERIHGLLSAGVDRYPVVRGLVLAMTLGETGGLPPAELESFRVTGTLHLFSVSGLHVGMIALLLWLVFRALPLPLPVVVALIIACLFFYSAVTGLKPSSLRAAFMASVVLGGLLLERPAAPVNSLLAAAFLLLLADGNQLFNPGFQLSFFVVFSIFLLGLPVQRWIREQFRPDPFLPRALYRNGDHVRSWFSKEFGGLAAVSISAWIGSLPLIAVYYHLISISAIPVNIAAVPLSFAILAVAMLSMMTGWIWIGFSEIFNHTSVLLGGILLRGIRWAAALPFASLPVPTLEMNPPQAEIVIFDAGAGSATGMRIGSRMYWMDTGSAYFAESTGIPWMARHGTTAIEGIFVTHGDAKHIGGAKLLAETFPVGYVGMSVLGDRSTTLKRLREYLERSQIPKRLLFAGDRVPLNAGWYLSILYPPAGKTHRLADDKNLVAILEKEDFRLLWLGDAGEEAVRWMIANRIPPVTGVVVGNHSELGRIPENLLQETGAEWFVFSSENFPDREKLAPNWGAVLEANGARVFRQNESGAVTIRVWRDGRVEAGSFVRQISR